MKNKWFKTLLLVAAGCLAFAANAQTTAGKNIIVSGTVVDANNVPIIGAGVTVKGTTSGTVTDVDGRYKLTAPSGSTLSFSSLGYVSQEFVADRGTINVTLAEDSEMLQETVVIGYGVQKKVDVTGAVSSVGSKDLANRPAADVAGMLAGKVSGVQVIPGSGQPGESGSIRVRGISSNSSSSVSPLYIVDGLQVSDINYLDPSNIESIDILKDGASAAIYGAQAGNGVILVTTKKGKKGEGHVFYDGSFSIESLGYHPTMMNAAQYKEYMFEANLMNEADLKEAGYDGTTDTDWTKALYGNGYIHKHTVGVKGANEKGGIYAAISYYSNDGMLITDRDYYKRLNFQVNADYKIKKWLKLGTNNNFRMSKKGLFESAQGAEHDDEKVFIKTMMMSPLQPLTYANDKLPKALKNDIELGRPLLKHNGQYISRDEFGVGILNPLGYFYTNEDYYTSGMSVNGTTFLELNPIKGLVITSRIGYSFGSSNSGYFAVPFYFTSSYNREVNALRSEISKSFRYNWENFVNYDVTIAKDHNLSAMAGMSFISKTSNNIAVAGENLPSSDPNFRYLDYLPKANVTSLSGNETKNASLSYFARLGYNYKSRYFIQATFRADAYDTSKLAPENRWGYFPSVSAGWTLTNEDWMAPVKNVLSFLKVRGSWGINGNVGILSGYKHASTVTVGSKSYFAYLDANKTLTYGSIPAKLANKDLKWETAYQTDLGFDSRFFNDRLSLSFDWYNKDTKDLLVETTVSGITGFTSVVMNAGSINNKGFDIELGWKDSVGDFTYGISANFSRNRNLVTSVAPNVNYITGAYDSSKVPLTIFEEGHSTWHFYGYKFTGVDPATGKPMV